MTYYTEVLDSLSGVSFNYTFNLKTLRTCLMAGNEVVAYLSLHKEKVNNIEVYRVKTSAAQKGLGQPLYVFTMMLLEENKEYMCCDNIEYMSKDAIKVWRRLYSLDGLNKIGISDFDEEFLNVYPEFIEYAYNIKKDNRYSGLQKGIASDIDIQKGFSLYENMIQGKK